MPHSWANDCQREALENKSDQCDTELRTSLADGDQRQRAEPSPNCGPRWMEPAMWASILSEWASLIFRWLHVIAAIGWIGSSFYFIHLDLELKPREGLPEGAHGDAWQVHGGGFYHIVKFLVAPAKLPAELTWFKWEAYTTWL